MLSDSVAESARKCVLCWLATCDAQGQPNVSPKEVFAPFDAWHLVIANIASANSARNIALNPKVCVSFIDIFVQKGYKVSGLARDVRPGDARFAELAQPLEAMTGGRFPIRSVFLVEAKTVEALVAPSYRLYAAETTEESQRRAALATYGVRPGAAGGTGADPGS